MAVQTPIFGEAGGPVVQTQPRGFKKLSASGDKEFLVQPDNYDCLIADPATRGRYLPPSPEAVEALKQSILQHGQLQPILVKRHGKDQYRIIFGFTRYEAFLALREEGHTFPIKVKLTTTPDEDCFLMTLDENRTRTDLSPVDHFANARTLKEKYGKKNTEIAKIFHISPQQVGNLLKLGSLPDNVLKDVHENRVTFSAALLIANLPADKVDMAVAVAKDGGMTALKDMLRGENTDSTEDTCDGEGSDEGDGGEAPVRSLSRSAKQIKKYFNEILNSEDKWSEEVKDLAEALIEFMEGRITERQMTNRFVSVDEAIKGDE